MKADLTAIEARLERVPREYGLCLDMKDWGKDWEVARITNCMGRKECSGDHVITTVNLPASVRANYNEHDEAVFLANAPQDMHALVHEVKRSRAFIIELLERLAAAEKPAVKP